MYFKVAEIQVLENKVTALKIEARKKLLTNLEQK